MVIQVIYIQLPILPSFTAHGLAEALTTVDSMYSKGNTSSWSTLIPSSDQFGNNSERLKTFLLCWNDKASLKTGRQAGERILLETQGRIQCYT